MRREKPKTAVYFLISELLVSKRVPPVTLAVIALNVLVYLELFEFKFPSLDAVCLSASAIIYKKQWLRLIYSAIFHADDWHLYYNMISFSIKGRSLEKRYGSGYYLFLIIVFTISCSISLVGIEYLAFYVFKRKEFLLNCAVGFSGVIFALKVLTTHNLPQGTVYMFNTIPVPSKYAYWAELVAISIATPNASFAGHLAGILVGLAYIYGPLKLIIDLITPYKRQNNIENEQYENYNNYQNNGFYRYR